MELSILIPARNEMFLKNTVMDILENRTANTEVIVVLDGKYPVEPLEQRRKLNVIYLPESIGQRAATNMAFRMARGKYVMKVDAHCAFDKGFDSILLEDIQDDWTIVPVMKNLHAFDWVCTNGHRRYQGPSGVCPECGASEKRDILWRAKKSPNSTAYRFDKNLKFAYWSDYKKKQTGNLVETMSLQGSCFMMTKDKYWELNICDEEHGSWGQQGTEVALKTWLSGGKVIVDKKTWYAHMFRTQGGDFGFPYPLSGRAVKKARDYSKSLFIDGKWSKAKYTLDWLLDKFSPVPEWSEA